MQISLATSLHLDHGASSLDQRPGDEPKMQAFVPVGLLSLQAALERTCPIIDVRVVEVNGLINAGQINNDSLFYDRVVDSILRENDAFVGLMTDADSLHHTIATARVIKRRSPDTWTCFGGPAASPISQSLLETFPFIDFVVRGEGENTLAELIQSLKHRRKLAEIRGLTWRDNGIAVVNPDRPVIDNVDELPFPAFESYDMAAGAPLYLDVGRGCPFKCRFCATAPFWSRRYRMKSIDRIVQEMRHVRIQFGRHHVNFSHDIFTCDKKWTLAFCDQLHRTPLQMTWSCSTRTDVIDPEILTAMAKAGCVEIYYGIETGSQITQDSIDKGLDLGWARHIVRTTAEVGIRPVTGFIVGHPGETRQTLGDTLEKFFDFLQLGKGRAHLFTLCPFHEAPMYREHQPTISRRAQYLDLPLAEPIASEIEQLTITHRDIFSSIFRFATPSVPSSLIDASEELSCHLVVLKSLWALLLPYYDSPMEWYERWVAWIEVHNLKYRPNTRLRTQGSAYDLLSFVRDELTRLELTNSDIAELAKYEETKLDARRLAAPLAAPSTAGDLSNATTLVRRCNYLAFRLHFDLEALLNGRRACRLAEVEGSWVIFAKIDNSHVDTLRMSDLGKRALELASEPLTIADLVFQLEPDGRGDRRHVMSQMEHLYRLGLLCEVTQ